MKLSGIITLSAEECEISRSCHSAMFSRLTIRLDLNILARPQILSQSIGFLLCGIAEEPFWPFAKGSSISFMSVFWSPLTSRAIFSRVAPHMAIALIICACLSLCKICVDAGDGLSSSVLQTFSSTWGIVLAYVPTAPDILP